jgi:hypothetical protein
VHTQELQCRSIQHVKVFNCAVTILTTADQPSSVLQAIQPHLVLLLPSRHCFSCCCRPQVFLQQQPLKPSQVSTFFFVVFGGGNQATYWKPCIDFSLRIQVTVDCTVSPCTHSIGQWEEETMPSPRCQHDSTVLPNGKVILIGGVEEGYSGLGNFPVSVT